jgi:uncharacterized surface protein with fasciclin (FAS1) repeats
MRTAPWRRRYLAPLAALGTSIAVLAAPAGAAAQAQSDIADTAVAAGQFTTLARALQAAGLVDTLKGPGPYTVFAPTDAAFARVPAASVGALLADKAALTRVLTYHVVPGRLTAAQVGAMPTVGTVEGGNLAITASGSTVRVNNATVVTPDVQASNGVIHVIDTVLLPPTAAGGRGGAPAQAPRALPNTGDGGSGLPLGLAVAAAGLVLAGLRLRLSAARARAR